MLEVRQMYFNRRNRRTGEVTKKGGKGLMVLFIILYIVMAGAFFALASFFGMTLFPVDGEWIYFTIMAVIAFVLGLFGGVFTTASALFQAKDNEFLLAMPIPPSKILLARMVMVYIMGLIYESMVMLPTILYYFFFGHPTALSVIFCILGIFVLGFLVLVFSCLFGWIIALISSKLKNKSFLTVIIMVIVIAAFIWLRFSMNRLMQSLAEHATEIGDAMRGWGYPIYSLGLGMSGDALAFLAFTAITAALFAITICILSRSFNRIVSTKTESIKKTFSEGQIQTRSISAALRKKEMKRFTASPGYMINCGLGLLFLVAGGILLLVKMTDVRYLLGNLASTSPVLARMIPVFGVFAICLLASLVEIAAPSISLEAHNIWILQTLPVDPFAVFRAKAFVHIVLTEGPALFCAVTMIIALRTDVFTSICMLLCVAAFVWLSAIVMLSLDLKRPMMNWTNEMQPIKQSINILFDMFGGFLLSVILAALYFLVGIFVGPAVYLLICAVIFAVLTFLLYRWLKGKGRVLFANL